MIGFANGQGSQSVEEQIVSGMFATLKEAALELQVRRQAVCDAQVSAFRATNRIVSDGTGGADWLQAQSVFRAARTRRDHALSVLEDLIEQTTELLLEPADDDSPAADVVLKVPAVLEQQLCELADAVALARRFPGDDSLSERGHGPSPLDEALTAFIAECSRRGQ